MDTKKNFLNNEKKVNQVYYVVLGFLVASLIVLFASFLRLDNASRELADVNKNRLESNRLATKLKQSSENLTRMARTYVLTGDEAYLEQYKQVLAIRKGGSPRPLEYHREFWQLIDLEKDDQPRGFGKAAPLNDLLKEAGFTPEEFDKLNEAESLSNKLAELESKAFDLVKGLNINTNNPYAVAERAKQNMAISLLFGNEYTKQKRLILQPIDDFMILMEERLDKDSLKAEEAFKTSAFFFYTVMFLSAFLIAALFYLTRLLNKIQLNTTLQEQEKAEEANEKINNSIINILQSVSQLSQKDLTARAPVTDDVVGTVSDSINYLADETGRVMQEVKDVAVLVKDSTNKVKSQAQQVTDTAEEERETVANMFDSLYEATETMNQVAVLAEETNAAGNKATEVTKSALETVNGTVQGMESIRTTIAETEKRIKRLGERSQEISGIVSLINTISERTHVLALNASMQAAVAGEAGRGFAVVAEEVQRLAESSQNATQQIESLVNNIQIETNETINTVNNTITQVVEGSEQAQKAGEQMRQTQEITSKLVDQVRFIAAASDKQKQMSSQLLESVKLIGDSTEQTASQISLQNQETESLQLASDRLVETVSVFKLPKRK